jgi:hypothetical protein
VASKLGTINAIGPKEGDGGRGAVGRDPPGALHRGGRLRALARRTGLDRQTIRRALRSDAPPRYERAPAASKLDAHRDEIHRLLRAEPRMPATRIRELITEAGYTGGRTILEEYLREVRPLLPRLRAPSSARSTGPTRSASSTCGSPLTRSRSATARRAGRGCWWLAWATRAPVRGAHLQQAGRGHPHRDRALPVASGGPAEDAGVGSRRCPARGGRAAH